MNSKFLLSTFSVAAALCVMSAPAADSNPHYKVGEKAPAFEAKTTDGKTVKFPDAYKGKVVLLDFWATWCGPCREEMPNVTSAYEKFHARGFDVLGISLDRANEEATLSGYTRDHNMPWPQVYDGKFWNAAVAKQYGIHSIPRPILVDGDTGKIIAEGPDVRGDKLAPLIEKSLANKKS